MMVAVLRCWAGATPPDVVSGTSRTPSRLTLCGVRLSCTPVRVVGVRDWRFNQRLEDIEWLLKLSSADGSVSTGVLHASTHTHALCSTGLRPLSVLHQT